MKQLKAYLYWYQVSEFSKPTYIWIFAVSKKQALFFFYREGLNTLYDFDYDPCEVRSVFKYKHKAGDILGDLSIL